MEQIAPENSTYYFIVRNSGNLATRDLKPSDEMQKRLDTDRNFVVVEIDHDQLYFQTVVATG